MHLHVVLRALLMMAVLFGPPMSASAHDRGRGSSRPNSGRASALPGSGGAQGRRYVVRIPGHSPAVFTAHTGSGRGGRPRGQLRVIEGLRVDSIEDLLPAGPTAPRRIRLTSLHSALRDVLNELTGSGTSREPQELTLRVARGANGELSGTVLERQDGAEVFRRLNSTSDAFRERVAAELAANEVGEFRFVYVPPVPGSDERSLGIVFARPTRD